MAERTHANAGGTDAFRSKCLVVRPGKLSSDVITRLTISAPENERGN